jgi:hypothetical protein
VQEGLSANFIRSPYISEKSCDCGGLRDTSWTTPQTTFSAPDPPALKWGVETLNIAARPTSRGSFPIIPYPSAEHHKGKRCRATAWIASGDGWRRTRFLKSQPFLVFATGYGEPIAEAALEAPILEKPFKFDQLTTALAVALANR